MNNDKLHLTFYPAKRLLFIFVILIGNASHILFSQWERVVPNYECLNPNATLTDSTYIWGGGNLGRAFKYNYRTNELKNFQLKEDLDIYSIWYQSDSLIHLGGRDWEASNGFYIIFDPIADSILNSIRLPYEIWDIEFISKDTGFIASYSGIHKTTDAGISWEIIWDFQSIGARYGELYSLTSDNNGYLYASGRKAHNKEGSTTQGLILRSLDSGQNWKMVYEIPDGYITNMDYGYGKIYCHDKHHISYYYSNDMGDTWEKEDIFIADSRLRIADLIYINENHLIACIAQDYLPELDPRKYTVDQIISSPDSGNTWYLQHEQQTRFPPRDTTLKELISVNDTTLFCFGSLLCLKTQNQGGANEQIIYSSRSNHLIPLNTKMYPNPARDFIFLEGVNHTYKYSIHSIDGKMVVPPSTNMEGNKINIKNLKEGMYIIHVIANENYFYSKPIIKL